MAFGTQKFPEYMLQLLVVLTSRAWVTQFQGKITQLEKLSSD